MPGGDRVINVAFDFSKITAKLDRLAKIVTQGARPAAQAGAQVFYDEVKQRAATPGNEEKRSAPGEAPFVQSGKLRDAIYQAFVEKESGYLNAVYRISWNKKAAPHGHLVENGTSRMAARPFLRPSYDAKRTEAIQAVNARLKEEIKGFAK